MSKRTKTGSILHARRRVVSGRPMHLTIRVRRGVGSLRRPQVKQVFVGLIEGARARGVSTIAYAIMGNHIHWFVRTRSRRSLRDGTRYVFGRFARLVNRLFGRRGRLFEERYWSSCCASARQAFAALGYLLRNPVAAGYRIPASGRDRYVGIRTQTIEEDPFLRTILGFTPAERRAVLMRMSTTRLAYVPIAERCQPRLPGL